MPRKTLKSHPPEDLRLRAESLLENHSRSMSQFPASEDKDSLALIHELEVHQIELEMQNEELKHAQLEAERAQEKYFDLFNLAPVGYFMLDEQGLILEVNIAGAGILGRDIRDLLHKRFQLWVQSDSLPAVNAFLKSIFSSELKQTCEAKIQKNEGGVLYTLMKGIAVENDLDSGKQCRIAILDITERKQMEGKIQISLKEKEILLRELHHRVKNNMQIISSFLQIQNNHTQDANIRNVLDQTQNLIHSMALVHEKLYQSENLSEVNYKDYLEDLSAILFRTYKLGKQKISLKTELENITLSIDAAIPLGIVINELLTNSLKHAFPGDREGEIFISMHSPDQRTINIIFKDNGIGLPKDVNFHKISSMGLKCAKGLIEYQLGGRLILLRENGTEYRIQFNQEEMKNKFANTDQEPSLKRLG